MAHEYYGSHEFDWVVMLSARAFNWMYEIPLPYNQLVSYLEDRYQTTVYDLQSTLHHYEDSDGATIDLETYTNISDPGKKQVSIFDFGVEQNEMRRSVKLISKRFLQQINEEFDEKIKELKKARKTFFQLSL